MMRLVAWLVLLGGVGCGQLPMKADAGCAQVVGQKDPSVCRLSVAHSSTFETCCAEQGGVMGGGCTSSECNFHYSAMCYAAPPPPAANEFSCKVMNCRVGEVCLDPNWYGDHCAYPACRVPPAPCANTPTCACMLAQPSLAVVNCTEDDAGNATVSDQRQW